MHYSCHNHIGQNDDGTCLLFNFLTGHGMVLSESGRAFYDGCLQSDESHPVAARLKDVGFIADYDEVAYLRSLAQGTTFVPALEF